MVRIAHGVVSLPMRLHSWLHCLRLRDHCDAAEDAELAYPATIHSPFDRGAVRIGSRTLFMGEIIVMASRGEVHIGDWGFVGPGAKIWAMEKIEIGSHVQIAHGVQIFDNNSHSLSASERRDRFEELQTHGRHLQPEKVAHEPIRIEDDVWIGFNAAILKGVTIGRGAVIGACSVVTHDVPAYSVMVGNPARKVGDSRP